MITLLGFLRFEHTFVKKRKETAARTRLQAYRVCVCVQEREDGLLKQNTPDKGSVDGADMRTLSLSDSSTAEVAVNKLLCSKVNEPSQFGAVRPSHPSLSDRRFVCTGVSASSQFVRLQRLFQTLYL